LTLFLGSPKSLQVVIAALKLKDAYSLERKLLPTDRDSINNEYIRFCVYFLRVQQ